MMGAGVRVQLEEHVVGERGDTLGAFVAGFDLRVALHATTDAHSDAAAPGSAWARGGRPSGDHTPTPLLSLLSLS